ncbi:MAG: type I methionyl aminopeptidase [Cellulomonadaceae bacterium]
MFGRVRIEQKSPEQIRLMRRAGLVVADVLSAVRAEIRPGTSTASLDALAADAIAAAGASSSFLGYEGYPATVCVSVNDEVVHGVPGPRVLARGDVVSVDCGVALDGWHCVAAITVIAGEADKADEALVATSRKALWAGIAALADAERVCSVATAIDGVAKEGRFGLVRDYVAHGIGSTMHQPPEVLGHKGKDRGPRVSLGMCLAIEPMLTRGERFTQVCENDWTVVTDDGSRAAHWEHTVAVVDGGVWVLTAPDGGAADLAPFGIVPAAL